MFLEQRKLRFFDCTGVQEFQVMHSVVKDKDKGVFFIDDEYPYSNFITDEIYSEEE